MAEERVPIVIDPGSCTTRIGLATDLQPHAFHSIMGDGCTQYMSNEYLVNRYFVGEDSPPFESDFHNNLRYPIIKGNFRSWDDFEFFISSAIYHEAKISSHDGHPFLISEPPFNSRTNREKITEIMFERFNVPSLGIANHGVLSLYSSGRTTGLVLVSGDGVTSVTPVLEGFGIAGQVKKLDMIGMDLTLKLRSSLNQMGHTFNNTGDLLNVREIKNNLCYVSVKDCDIKPREESYVLPDGQNVTLGDEAYQIPELLFSPQDLESTSFPRAVYDSIMKCDVSIRKSFYQNIILCGGNTMYPGFVERMDLELSTLVPSTIEVKTVPNSSGLDSVWLGGAILASLSTFKTMCVFKEEYDELGARAIHRKMQ